MRVKLGENEAGRLEPVVLELATPASDRWPEENKNASALRCVYRRAFLRSVLSPLHLWDVEPHPDILSVQQGKDENIDVLDVLAYELSARKRRIVTYARVLDLWMPRIELGAPPEITLSNDQAKETYTGIMYGIGRLAGRGGFPPVGDWLGQIEYVKPTNCSA